MRKNIMVSELIETIEAEMREEKKEAYFWNMMLLFPQLTKNKYEDNTFKYETWANEANERYYKLMKDRSILRDMVYFYSK